MYIFSAYIGTIWFKIIYQHTCGYTTKSNINCTSMNGEKKKKTSSIGIHRSNTYNRTSPFRSISQRHITVYYTRKRISHVKGKLYELWRWCSCVYCKWIWVYCTYYYLSSIVMWPHAYYTLLHTRVEKPRFLTDFFENHIVDLHTSSISHRRLLQQWDPYIAW